MIDLLTTFCRRLDEPMLEYGWLSAAIDGALFAIVLLCVSFLFLVAMP